MTKTIDNTFNHHHRIRVLSETRESELKIQIAETTTDKCMSSLLQRPATNSIGNTLQAYTLDGNPPVNPAVGDTFITLRAQISFLIQHEVRDMSLDECELMPMLVPKLLAALVLTEGSIDQAYLPTITDAVAIAIDWFKNPNTISETEFRIGYGASEEPAPRSPAYLLAPIESIEQIATVFKTHENWAIARELHALFPEKSEEIDDWISQELEKVALSQGEQIQRTKSWVNEIIKPDQLKPFDINTVVRDAWRQFAWDENSWDVATQLPLDDEHLQEKYHYTSALPTIRVIDGSNAGIAINGMDETKVLATRQFTQQFLSDYVHTFHPTIEIQFQNDVPWHEWEQNPLSRLMVHYTQNIINGANGVRKKADAQLEIFSAHHTQNGHNVFADIQPHILYGILHPFFFQDVPHADWIDRLPNPGILTSVPAPRNIIFPLSSAEQTFQVYREFFSKNASVSGMIEWLTAIADGRRLKERTDITIRRCRQLHTSLGYDLWTARQVVEKLKVNKVGKKPTPEEIQRSKQAKLQILSNFEDALQTDCTGEQVDTLISHIEQSSGEFGDILIFDTGFITKDFERLNKPKTSSELFRIALDESGMLDGQFGNEILSIIKQNKNATLEELERTIIELYARTDIPEDTEQIELVLAQLSAHQNNLNLTREQIRESLRSNDGSLTTVIPVEYPLRQTSFTVAGLRPPPYYLGPADVSLSSGELPSVQNYTTTIDQMVQTKRGLESTGIYLTRKVLPATDELTASLYTHLAMLDIESAPTDYNDLMETDTLRMEQLIQEAYSAQLEGIDDATIIAQFKQGITDAVQKRIQSIFPNALNADEVFNSFLTQVYFPNALQRAHRNIQEQFAAQINQVRSCCTDYIRILADINPDQQVAEASYRDFISQHIN